MTTIEYIRLHVSRDELLCQLAEEAAELAQAALKLRRAEGENNPTPVTPEQALLDLYEEIADVNLALWALAMGTEPMVNTIMGQKSARWCVRLERRENGWTAPNAEAESE